MYSTLLFLAITVQPADNLADGFFAKLDRNHDGTVTRDELSESQRTFFARALRVADGDEDGALTAEELAKATSDPKPVELPGSNMAGRMANLDFKSFDSDGNGELTLSEVPAPMRERFEKMLDQLGKKSIPISQIENYLRGERPSETDKASDDRKPEMNSDSMMADSGDPDERRQALIKRLDANGNGTIEKDEHARFPQLAAMLDRNRDGRISKEELKSSATPNDPMIQPAERSTEKGKGRSESNGKRAEDEMSDSMFERLDQNSDGKLAGDEIPRRMQQIIKAADENKDGRISKSEFEGVLKRRNQK